MFELGKLDYYTPKLVELIEEFDPDQYGNRWYGVVFAGDAETYLWLAKNKPEVDKRYYGHIEETKSGKRLRFKTDKQPEDHKSESSPTKKSDAYLKDVSNTCVAVYNGSLNYAKEAGLNLISDAEDRRAYLDYVQEITNELMSWIDKARNAD